MKLKVEEPIPTDVNIIVIADMRVPFSDDELKNIEQYIERGGNLVINTDINREKQMEPLIKLLGVGTIPGILAQGNSGYPPTSVFSYFSDSNKMVSSYLPSFKDRRIPIVMKGCVGLIKKSDKGFEVESLMEARRGTWNVTATSNPDEIEEDSLAANTTEIYSTALSLTRDIGGREQRVLIFGDSDWFSKGELSAGWTIAVANEYLISTMFKWMSYDKYPISFDRPSLPDNELHFKYKHKELSNLFFLFLFPLFWLGCGSVVWYRRKIK
ncbi:hypothetical protein SDC9_145817 [bioreactor metagenome]|uniref:ABC-type uncharacterized transport system domain-containing protein n=1 Tax=bioreactor metagenome TaxID=1076179 RepID=A0A645EBE4_9ZZZZ